MRKIIHREIPHFIGFFTLAILAFMILAVIWLGEQQMNKEIYIQEGNIGEILYKFFISVI